MLVYWLKIKTPESIENQLEYIIKNLDEKKLNLFARIWNGHLHLLLHHKQVLFTNLIPFTISSHNFMTLSIYLNQAHSLRDAANSVHQIKATVTSQRNRSS